MRQTVLSGKEYLKKFTQGWHCALLWNKLYTRSLFDGIFFEEGHRIDDEYFTYQGMMNAAMVVCDGKVIYNYRRRMSGAMLNPQAGQQRMLDRVDYMEKRRRKIAERYPELQTLFDTEFVDAMIYFTEYPENTLISLDRIKQALKSYLLESGNSLPPRHLWRGVLRVLLTSSQKLLENCPQSMMDNHEDYFA